MKSQVIAACVVFGCAVGTPASAHTVDRVELKLTEGKNALSGHPRVSTLRIRMAQREYYFRSQGVATTGHDQRRIKALSNLLDFVPHTGAWALTPIADDHVETWNYSLTFLSKDGALIGELSGNLPRPAPASELRARLEGPLSLLASVVDLFDVAKAQAAPELAAAACESARRLPRRLFSGQTTPLVSKTTRYRVHHHSATSSEVVFGVQISADGAVEETWSNNGGLTYRLRPELLRPLARAVEAARDLPSEGGEAGPGADIVYELGGRRLTTLVRLNDQAREAALQELDRALDEALGHVLQRARVDKGPYDSIRLFGLRDHEEGDPTELSYDDMRVDVPDAALRERLIALQSMPEGASVLLEGRFKHPRFVVERIVEAPTPVENVPVQVDEARRLHDVSARAAIVIGREFRALFERVRAGSMLSVDGLRTTSPSGDRLVITGIRGRVLNNAPTRRGMRDGPRLRRGDLTLVTSSTRFRRTPARYKVLHGDGRLTWVSAVHVVFDPPADVAAAPKPKRNAGGLILGLGE